MGLLRSRGFLLLWSGQFLGVFGDWSLRTMLLIWAFTLTGSGVVVSLVGLAEALPLLVLSPIAGVFVDRWNRAATMTAAVLARAVLLLPLLSVHSKAGLPLLLLVTVLANAASQLFLTAASAAVPVVVGSEQVGAANSLLSLINGAIAAVGPGAAALLFALFGPQGTVLILGSVYLIAAPILAFVPAPRPADATGAAPSFIGEMLDGLRYVRRSALLVSLIVTGFVALLGFGALSVLDVVFVTRALHLHSETVGVLLTCSGIGELLGGIVMSVVSAWAARRYHLLLGTSILAMGMILIGYAVSPTLQIAAALLFVVGLMFPPLLVSFMTLIQLESEDAFMGRVMSLVNMGMAVAMIASLTFGGVLTDLFGVRQVIAGGAVILIAAGLLTLARITNTPAPRQVPDSAATVDAVPQQEAPVAR